MSFLSSSLDDFTVLTKLGMYILTHIHIHILNL